MNNSNNDSLEPEVNNILRHKQTFKTKTCKQNQNK